METLMNYLSKGTDKISTIIKDFNGRVSGGVLNMAPNDEEFMVGRDLAIAWIMANPKNLGETTQDYYKKYKLQVSVPIGIMFFSHIINRVL